MAVLLTPCRRLLHLHKDATSVKASAMDSCAASTHAHVCLPLSTENSSHAPLYWLNTDISHCLATQSLINMTREYVECRVLRLAVMIASEIRTIAASALPAFRTVDHSSHQTLTDPVTEQIRALRTDARRAWTCRRVNSRKLCTRVYVVKINRRIESTFSQELLERVLGCVILSKPKPLQTVRESRNRSRPQRLMAQNTPV